MWVNDALVLAQDKARIYREESRVVEENHALAMAYYDFQDFLEFGINLFDSITKIDEDWRLRVLKHEFDYDPAIASRILDVYKTWFEPCAEIERIVSFLEQRFGNRGQRCGISVAMPGSARYRYARRAVLRRRCSCKLV